MFWKLGGPGARRDRPGYKAAAGKEWTLDQFTHPHSLHSRFFVRYHAINYQHILCILHIIFVHGPVVFPPES